MANLLGTAPNQVPTNADLGAMAFMDYSPFMGGGTGSFQRNAQDKMRERISVEDKVGGDPTGVADSLATFNLAALQAGITGQVHVGRGIWRLSGVTSSTTWVVDAQATFVGAGTLTGRIVRFGGGGVFANAMKVGGTTSWLETERASTENNADLVVLSSIGQAAFVAGSRTSDFLTAASEGCIGVEGYAINNNATQVQSAYAGYFEARKKTGAGTTHGIEIDIVNQGSLVSIDPDSMGTSGLTNALWLASGGGVVGAATASLALGIINNGARFEKGMQFQANALEITGGEGVAFALAVNHALLWYAGPTKIARIRNDATTASAGIIFANDALNIQTLAGSTKFAFDVSLSTLSINGLKVLGARETGYVPMTGTANKGTSYDTSSVTVAQLAGRVMSLQASYTTHGQIGV